ncbi:MAG: hypothetical protein AVDCRST_MAG01-01-2763 [uncultured Rubrobacteraceae bacterium]|uniref:J domain-containing protein n=1 Tax=uncultured Rubrobacteraceae bacterium TaxID=349277 RepID=A0A6J4Q5Z8_9ACTN|nr:MAG: hypothetical protein AVDCRST_MAG01-01-2763 [uncultured Rubrobacteraceae bacterium]
MIERRGTRVLGVKAIRRRLRRRALRRKGYRPEEEVFDRFAERFGPMLREPKPEGPQEEPREEFREERQEETRQERPWDASSQPLMPAVPASPALEVLGLGAGASPEEIAAAYKRMARTYHPDKVAGEAQEVREFAEDKMKEINAAYSELKRHR